MGIKDKEHEVLEVDKVFAPPNGWTDTPEQAQIRACLSNALDGIESPIERIKVSADLIQLLRDQLLTGLAQVRKTSALELKGEMTTKEITELTGLTGATVQRLLYTGRRA